MRHNRQTSRAQQLDNHSEATRASRSPSSIPRELCSECSDNRMLPCLASTSRFKRRGQQHSFPVQTPQLLYEPPGLAPTSIGRRLMDYGLTARSLLLTALRVFCIVRFSRMESTPLPLVHSVQRLPIGVRSTSDYNSIW